MVLEPELIILDEPTAGQDYRHYTEIMEFLRSLNEQGTTILLITHDMHLMLEYTPHAIVCTAAKSCWTVRRFSAHQQRNRRKGEPQGDLAL